jgi:hypothetical protein
MLKPNINIIITHAGEREGRGERERGRERDHFLKE